MHLLHHKQNLRNSGSFCLFGWVLLGAIIYFTPYSARLCTRFFISVSLITILQGSIIIMFTSKMGELSPSSIKEFAQGHTGRKRLSWNTNLGQWDLNISSFHNSVFYCLSWWERGKRALHQHLLPSSRYQCHAWPGAWHLWAWWQLQWDFASIKGWAGWHGNPNCENECLVCFSSPLGGVLFGQNT